jgi:hypothetical protein
VGRAISTATLNDVLIATVTGAMRRYLKSRNTRVNELNLGLPYRSTSANRAPNSSWATSSAWCFCPCRFTWKIRFLRLKESKDEWIGSKPHRTP